MLQTATGTDEGLYALVAREWLNGHLPYTTVWETKPPLFFALLAVAMAVFGKTMIAIRIANDLAIAATASALYAIGLRLRRDGRTIGIVAACFYAALTISDSGQSAVAETFAAPFVAVAFALILRTGQNASEIAVRATGLGIGASLAAAVFVKESVGLEALYAAAIALATGGLGRIVPLAIGAVVVAGASMLPYIVTNTFALFWDANVATLARRAPVPVPDVASWHAILVAQLLAFFPATLLLLGVPWALRDTVAHRDDSGERRTILVMLGWIVASLATVASIREYLGNHFIGAMAPACVLAAIVTVRAAGRVRSRARPIVAGVVAIALIAHAGYQFVLAAPVAIDRIRSGDPTYGDVTAELAAYISAHRLPAQMLYVADDRTVLYVLAGAPPPTRFAYPAHLLEPYQEIIAGVDGAREIRRVLDLHPTFIVRDTGNVVHEDPRGAALLDNVLSHSYRSAFSVGAHHVYVRDVSGMNAR